jgi:YHS domain-containing protein
MLYREGDYVGSGVNLAWRVASEAPRHGVLVTSEVRKEAAGLEDVEFVRTERRKLKGVAGELDLFEVRRSGVARSAKAIDPVCGMELGPAEVAARLTAGGRERAFCSDDCLRRFVAAPERYGG